jgi:signal transduction histidine kinase
MRAVPVRTDDGSVREWVASCTDIEEQRAAQEALIKSEKLAVAGRLAASIAHEINNPLEAVTNLLYLISHSGSLEEIREFTKMAQSELERVSHIATQTLRFYRQPSGATPTDVAELVDSVLALFQRRIQSSHIRLQTEFATSRPLVCYPGEVRQMVANLVGNAVDAMRAGGGLRLRVRECTDANRARGVAIVVADSGTGIPDSLRPRLFEPFMTTKGITGTGLGLWVTRELVQKHKGTVRVRSSTRTGASGTVFRIFLPYDAVEEKAPAAEAATATELRRGA